MQVFKTFFRIAFKKIPASLIYLFVFIILCLIFSQTNADSPSKNFKTSSLRLCIFDEDETAASQALTDYLGSIHELVPLEHSQEILLDHLFYRDVDYILEIPKGFEENLKTGNTAELVNTIEIPGTYSSSFVNEQMNTWMKSVQTYLAGGFSMHDAMDASAEDMTASTGQVTVLTFKDTSESRRTVSMFFFFRYLAYSLLAMLMIGMTPVLTTFMNQDLSKRITCSALTLSNKNMQLILGCSVYSLTIWLIMLIISGLLYGSSVFSEKGLLCTLNSFLLLLICVAIALTISCFSPTLSSLNMITNIITMSMCFLCGVFVPQSYLGKGVLTFSKYLPLYWYTKANDMIAGFSFEPFSYGAYWTYLGIELLFVAALFAIALTVTKVKSSKRKA